MCALCMLAPVVLDCSSHSPSKAPFLSPSLSDKSQRKSLLRFFGVAVDSNPFVPSTARITGSKYSRGAILGVPAWS